MRKTSENYLFGKGREREGLFQLYSVGMMKTEIEDCEVIPVHLVCVTLWVEEIFLKTLCRQVECSFCKGLLDFRFQIIFWIFNYLHVCNDQDPAVKCKIHYVSYIPGPIACRLTYTILAMHLHFDWNLWHEVQCETFY